jgi:O-antigen/teichoic acid export membrane protein
MSGAVDSTAAAEAHAGGLRRVIRGFGDLAAAQVISQLIAFAALAYVARRVGPSNLGDYAYALVLATYFNLFASSGIDYLGTRDIAQDNESLGKTVGETLVLQGGLSLLLYLALVLTAPLLATNPETRRLIPVVGLTLLTGTFTLDWALLALGRPRSVALWRVLGQIVYAAFIPILVVGGGTGTLHYAWLNILGLAVTSFGLMAVLFGVVKARPRVGGIRSLARRFRRSLPFGYSLIMLQIYGGVAILILGLVDSAHTVGIFSIATKLPQALIVLANVWLNVFFPHTAKRLADDPRDFAHDLGRVVTATIVISTAIVVGAFLCSGTLIPTMFGASFKASSEPFALLTVAAALILVQANFSNVLLAGGSQRYYAITVSVAAGAIVVLNLALIPLFGVIGAAIATVAAEVGLTTATFVGARRRLGPISLDHARLARGAAAVLAMGSAMYLARFLGGAVVQIGTALVAFAAAAWRFRAFDHTLIHSGPGVS